tara:strand:+ start:15956 stop:16933 length:978 start_codon:yes stop_codon:yes gene_type:complete
MSKIRNTILITGAAGFIGFHLADEILKKSNSKVIGIDNLNDYYSVRLKKKRISLLKKYKNFKFHKIDISDSFKITNVFKKNRVDLIFNLAAQAGVRYSLINPESYLRSNLRGFINILECAKIKKTKLIYASSSSVYGDQKKFPIKENIKGVQKNLYASTKALNEDIAELYLRSFKIPTIGLRFFTVYGEWGRPDMLYLKYLDALKNRKTINLFNYGNHVRDFTYIKDVREILFKLSNLKSPKNFQNNILNVCSNSPINLKSFISYIEHIYGKKCKIKKISKQKIEIFKTHGCNKKIKKLVKKRKFVNFKEGVRNTVSWFKNYYDL